MCVCVCVCVRVCESEIRWNGMVGWWMEGWDLGRGGPRKVEERKKREARSRYQGLINTNPKGRPANACV